MTAARRLFLIAGIYGLAVILPQYFLEARLGRDYPPAVTHPEYFYGFLGVGAAWQVAFLVIARDPMRYRLMIIPSVLEKLSFFTAAAILYWQGRVSPMLVGFGVVDLVFAILFVIAFVRLGGFT